MNKSNIVYKLYLLLSIAKGCYKMILSLVDKKEHKEAYKLCEKAILYYSFFKQTIENN